MNFQRGARCCSQKLSVCISFSVYTDLETLAALSSIHGLLFSSSQPMETTSVYLGFLSLHHGLEADSKQKAGRILAHFICYSCLRDHFPLLLDSQYPEYHCLIYSIEFINVSCFKWEDTSCHHSSILTIHFEMRWILIIDNIQVLEIVRRPSTMMWQFFRINKILM